MPAETHSQRELIDVGIVLGFLSCELDVDPDDADSSTLEELAVDDDLSILHLWESVAEEFGERTLGELELPDRRPRTVADLASVFHEALVERPPADSTP